MSNMKNLTTSLGVLLIILGLASYFGSGQESITAMIPSFFGLVFVIFGLLAAVEKIKKHVMHAAVGFALLSLIGTFSGVLGIFTLLTGGEVERPLAVYSQSAMFFMCLIYIIAAVISFKDARKAATEE